MTEPPTSRSASETLEDEKPPAKRSRLEKDVDEEEEEEEDEEEEDGEIVEDPIERLGSALQGKLCRPPPALVVLDPLLSVCASGTAIPGGLWLEFGVFSGKTINGMARYAPPATRVYGFDTFEGLPEDWRPGFAKGVFDTKGAMPRVAANVTLIKGLFQDTLEAFLQARPPPSREKVAVVHLDADLYSATQYVLEQLQPRIAVGSLLVFDELINFPGFREHEWKALLEWQAKYNVSVEVVAQSAVMEVDPVLDIATAQQVALRVTRC